MCLGTHYVCSRCELGLFRYARGGRCDAELEPGHRWLGTTQYLIQCERCRRQLRSEAREESGRITRDHEDAKALFEYLQRTRPIPQSDRALEEQAAREWRARREARRRITRDHYNRGLSLHPYIYPSEELEQRRRYFENQANNNPDDLVIRSRPRVFQECLRRQNEINATGRAITAEDRRYRYDMIRSGVYVVDQYLRLVIADSANAIAVDSDHEGPQTPEDVSMQDSGDEADDEAGNPNSEAEGNPPLGGLGPVVPRPATPVGQDVQRVDFSNEIAMMARVRRYIRMLDGFDPDRTIRLRRLLDCETLGLRAIVRGSPLIGAEVRFITEAMRWTTDAIESFRMARQAGAVNQPLYEGMSREDYVEFFNHIMNQGEAGPSNPPAPVDPYDSLPEDYGAITSQNRFSENSQLLMEPRPRDLDPSRGGPRPPRGPRSFSAIIFNHRTGHFSLPKPSDTNRFLGFRFADFETIGPYSVHDD